MEKLELKKYREYFSQVGNLKTVNLMSERLGMTISKHEKFGMIIDKLHPQSEFHDKGEIVMPGDYILFLIIKIVVICQIQVILRNMWKKQKKR